MKNRQEWLNLGFLCLRLAAGVIFVAHGAQKWFGVWGGGGWSATIEGFGGMGIAPIWAAAAIVTEFCGGLALVLGAFTRPAALGLAVMMLVAIWKVHAANGFFNSEKGFEYNLALLGMSLMLLFGGAGSWSLDRWIFHRGAAKGS